MKVCKECQFENIDEANYCAECGEKVEKDSVLFLISIILLPFFLVILLSYNKTSEEVLKIEEIPFKEKLSIVLNKPKGKFETTKDWKNSKKNSLDELLFTSFAKKPVGKISIDSYDADTENIKLNIIYNKSFKTLFEKELPKKIEISLSREMAKEMFGQKESRDIFALVSMEKSIFKVNNIYTENRVISYIFYSDTILLGNIEVANTRKDKKLNWQNAQNYCKALTYNRKSDWRIPNKEELQKIYKNRSQLRYFENSYYWSSTTNSNDSYDACVVYFNGGYSGYSTKDDNYYVRCVR